MRRRGGRWWPVVIVLVAAGAVLVLPGQRGGPHAGGSAPREVPATLSPAPAPAVPGAPDRLAVAPGGSPTGPPPARAPHHTGGVTGGDDLDPAARPHLLRQAERFARTWSTPDPSWPGRLADLADPALAAALAGAEPVRPPPGIAGAGTVLLGAPEWARVLVPTDRGDLVLDLTLTGAGWRVSGLDWRPVRG